MRFVTCSLGVALAAGCDQSTTPAEVAAPVMTAPQYFRSEWSPWSAPVNPGAPVNSSAQDQAPSISRNGLSLYFCSGRPGGFGLNDIWVARRASRESAWETPVNLGPVINSSSNDCGPALSADGKVLVFTSNRPGGNGLNDLYMSRRVSRRDDLGWGAPVPLGAEVNTSAFEATPELLETGKDGSAQLYFGRGPSNLLNDIYYARITRKGETRGPAVLVSELSDPGANEVGVTFSRDGREAFVGSNRPGALGDADIWVSTRRSVHHDWAMLQNLGATFNSVNAEIQPSLSPDGRTLLFASNRPGGLGGFDIWMSTRTSIHHQGNDHNSDNDVDDDDD
jgi:hypothetical protein